MQVYTTADVASIEPGRVRARVPAAVLADLRGRAERAGRLECCGLLVGRTAAGTIEVAAAVAAANVAADPARRFSIAAGTVLAGQRAAERAGLDVVGFYHSHPVGEAVPSPADIHGAFPGYLHVIVAKADVRAWHRPEADTPLEEVLL